jgi:hypothetical protein
VLLNSFPSTLEEASKERRKKTAFPMPPLSSSAKKAKAKAAAAASASPSPSSLAELLLADPVANANLLPKLLALEAVPKDEVKRDERFENRKMSEAGKKKQSAISAVVSLSRRGSIELCCQRVEDDVSSKLT